MRALRTPLSLVARWSGLAGLLVLGLLGAGRASAQRADPPGGGTPGGGTPGGGTPGGGTPGGGTPGTSATRWPVRTLPQVDLWLHAFALLSNDSAQAPTVPLYVRGYRDSMSTIRTRANVLTALDANQGALVQGLARAGGYRDAQFLPLEFASWDAFRRAGELFVQPRSGDARRQTGAFAAVFPANADREWLRLFLSAITDEQTRFFDDAYQNALRSRRDVVAAVDSLWQQVYRPRFDRFLNNSGQRQGEMVLSLPIGGEGRTTTGEDGRTRIAVPLPARVSDAPQALYVFAHELTGTLVGPVIADNVTPAELRSGKAARYTSLAQVVTGALLLTRIAPALREGYQRYYLAQVGVAIPAGGDVAAIFDRTFVLPSAMREALAKQLDLVLGGI